MRFSFVITNLAGGGAEKAVLKIAEYLTYRKHEVEIVLLEKRIEHKIPQVLRNKVSFLSQKISGSWVFKRILGWKLRQYFRKKPHSDIVISTLPFADEITSLAQIPKHWCRIANTLSSEIDDLQKSSPNKARRRLKRYQNIYGKHPLIANSDGVAEDLVDGLGLNTLVKVIPNPFDFSFVRKAATETASDIPDSSYVIHVGRFSAQKRHDLLLDAWSQVQTQAKLILLTRYDPLLEKMIQERKLKERVTIAGFKANPYPWIAGARLMVLSSDREGLPNVLIESLLCGTPVVSTDCPSGPREILGEYCSSYLVSVNDSLALASAISKALNDPIDISMIDLSRFTVDEVMTKYEQLVYGAD
jgi:glycosyltransferase involved in cell wall biosynthesis